jgi:signal transduction histidine kinase
MDIDVAKSIHYRAYPNQLSQVILNILHNSKDALELSKTKDPYIKIRLFKDNNYVIIEIKDNAGGVPKEIADKIFEANFTTKDGIGTGIGLYMSKTIITDNFNGRLYAKNSDNGAVFTIELPL